MKMVRWYFENAAPTYRFLHRPSVEAAIADGQLYACEDDCGRSSVSHDRSICAVVFMVGYRMSISA
jgi:hypothetical protein